MRSRGRRRIGRTTPAEQKEAWFTKMIPVSAVNPPHTQIKKWVKSRWKFEWEEYIAKTVLARRTPA